MKIDVSNENINNLQNIINQNHEPLEINITEDVILQNGLIIHDNTKLYSINKSTIRLVSDPDVHNSVIIICPKKLSPYQDEYKKLIKLGYPTNVDMFQNSEVKNVKIDNVVIVGNFHKITNNFLNIKKCTQINTYNRIKNAKNMFDFYQFMEWDYRFDNYSLNEIANVNKPLTEYYWYSCIKSNGISIAFGTNIQISNCTVINNISGGIVTCRRTKELKINNCTAGYNGYDGFAPDDTDDFEINNCLFNNNG